MAFWDALKNEFIDIIEWLDASKDTMVHRFPRNDNEIKNGAQLTVRESQAAVFENEGQIADVFFAGRYQLTTQNIPILSKLKGWKYGFESPFKAEVYFVNVKTFANLKWGTKNPIMLRDPEFGPVRVRAFGEYAIRVTDPGLFIKEVVGTNHRFSVEEISDQLRNLMVSKFTDILGTSKIPVLDLASNYNEFSEYLRVQAQPEFTVFGIEIVNVTVGNISLPPEVEAALDKRSSMGILGDLNKYTQFQAANAIENAAKNPGAASDAMNLGMGFAMGKQMAGMFDQNNQQQPNNQQQDANAASRGASGPPPLPGNIKFFVAQNGQQSGPFDMQTLGQMAQNGTLKRESLVWKEGMANWAPASQVQEMSALFGSMPPPLPM